MGNGVTYTNNNDNALYTNSIEINDKNDLYTIKITRKGKTQTIKNLTKKDIQLIGKQIFSYDSRDEWKEAIDQNLWLNNFREKHFKEFGVYPIITG